MRTEDRHRGVLRTFLWGATIVLVVWMLADLAGRYLELGVRGSVPSSMPSTMLALGSLLVALVATALAVGALRSARQTRREADVIIRALDLALRDRVETGRSFDMRDINDIVAREVARLTAGHAGPDGPAREPAAAPAASEPAAILRLAARPEQDRDLDHLVADAIARGKVELSLRPVVSLARGAAAAFDVFAHFDLGPDRQVDVGRIGDCGAALDLAAFEHLLVMEAIGASRRIVGDDDAVPLHVPVSDALLSSRAQMSALLDTARAHPTAAASIVLGLPAELAGGRGGHGVAFSSLANAGFAFAIQTGETDPVDPAVFRLPGAGWARVPTARLLGTRRERARAMPGQEIAERARAAGLEVIADDVQTDNDAIALVDLGVDLMVGPRFSGPRRLRRELGQVSRAAAE